MPPLTSLLSPPMTPLTARWRRPLALLKSAPRASDADTSVPRKPPAVNNANRRADRNRRIPDTDEDVNIESMICLICGVRVWWFQSYAPNVTFIPLSLFLSLSLYG